MEEIINDILAIVIVVICIVVSFEEIHMWKDVRDKRDRWVFLVKAAISFTAASVFGFTLIADLPTVPPIYGRPMVLLLVGGYFLGIRYLRSRGC